MEILDKVKRIHAITPHPGDMIIVQVDEDVTDIQLDEICTTMNKELEKFGLNGDNSSAVFYRGRIKVGIIRKED